MCAAQDLPEKKTTDAIAGLSAADIIRLLDLRLHPEGGHFRETFRDPAQDANGRSVSTLIYFLLQAGEVSRWHKSMLRRFGISTPGRRCRYQFHQPAARQASTASVLILQPASARNLLFPPIAGRAPKASGPGRSLAAPLRQASNFQASNSLR
jgi:hypothetical protein